MAAKGTLPNPQSPPPTPLLRASNMAAASWPHCRLPLHCLLAPARLLPHDASSQSDRLPRLAWDSRSV